MMYDTPEYQGRIVFRDITGILVPQEMYRVKATQAGWQPAPSIVCYVNGQPGLRLVDAQELPIPGLTGGEEIPEIPPQAQRATLKVIVRFTILVR